MAAVSTRILALVFASGAAALACELSASRLLAPAFGTSLPVWAAIIGMTLLCLSLGYALGGRLADRRADAGLLYRIVGVAALWIGIVPFAARPVLAAASRAMGAYDAGLVVGSFLGLALLIAVPVILLGMVTPFAARLLIRDVESAGRTTGRIFAVSTVGSLVGTFVPVLWLIPAIGTRLTFVSFGLALLAVVAWGPGVRARATQVAAGLGALALALLAVWVDPAHAARRGERVLFETESAHNYIRVVDEDGVTVLRLNEGLADDSVHRRDGGLPSGLWRRFALAPLLRPGFDADAPLRVAVLGGAAGTVGGVYARLFPNARIEQAEIDARILEVGRRFFGLGESGIEATALDARVFLERRDGPFDVFVLDAFRVPYVPFHLATREFFELLRERLAPEGVVVANVLGTSHDRALVDAIGVTMQSAFPRVYALDAPHYAHSAYPVPGNTLLFATVAGDALAAFRANAARLGSSPLARTARAAGPALRRFEPSGPAPLLTDDHAPVEDILHRMIWRFVREQAN